MNLIILGPQGSGKGTQAKFLSEEIGLSRLSIGQLYREEIKKKTKLGKEAEKYVLKGALVPLNITQELIKKELNKKKYSKGLILDGFPRNLEQYNLLNKIMQVSYVIFVDIPKKETIKRLSGRRVCTKCGENYNIHFDKVKKCKCGGELKQRKDDTPKAIEERLKVYQKDTLPLIKKYKDDKKLIKINGNQSIREVHWDIVKALDDKI